MFISSVSCSSCYTDVQWTSHRARARRFFRTYTHTYTRMRRVPFLKFKMVSWKEERSKFLVSSIREGLASETPRAASSPALSSLLQDHVTSSAQLYCYASSNDRSSTLSFRIRLNSSATLCRELPSFPALFSRGRT